MSIAENIKKLRRDLCLNKTEFAKLLSISRVSVSLYEKGERTPGYPIIRRMLEVANKHKIKLKVDDLLNDEKK